MRAINDREIADLVGFWGPVSKPMSEKWYEEEVVKRHGERGFYFTICELGSSELIGQCGLHDYLPGVRAEVGIFLLPEQVGRGYGTDAMNALVDYGFGELGLQRVGLHVSPGNERAIRSYEKCGFTQEGRMRSYRRRRGEIVDDILMSILRAEWEQLDRPRSWDLPPPPKPRKRRTSASGQAASARSRRSAR